MAILTKLDKRAFEGILKKYDIGKHRSNKHITCALGDTIYLLRTNKGKFILKIFETSDENFIKYQIWLMNVAEKGKLPVAKIIKTKNLKNIIFHNKKIVMIQRFIEGKPPKNLNNKLVKDIAFKQATLNKLLLKLKLTGKYTWGDYHFNTKKSNAKKYGKFNIRNEEENILNGLRKINKKKLRKSHVHADFHTINLLVQKGKLKAILDWDDAHEDYLVFDLATFIARAFVREHYVKKNQIILYLKEYQKILKLNKEEKKAVYYFIKQRYLRGICWAIKQLPKHKNMKPEIRNLINGWIEMYKTFDKVSLKEFLELF